MIFELTKDYALVKAILTHPAIYGEMGDDDLPDPEKFVVNDHPLARYVLAWREPHAGLVGVFCFYPQNRICWQGHVAMLPWVSTREKWRAGQMLLEWLWTHTECKRLVASIPVTNPKAIAFATHGVGVHYVGTHRQSFLKNGILRDVILLGASAPEQV